MLWLKNFLWKMVGFKIGTIYVIPNSCDAHNFRVKLPFTPSKVYIDYQIVGIGCCNNTCDICVEKCWNGFVVFYSSVAAEKITFNYIAIK